LSAISVAQVLPDPKKPSLPGLTTTVDVHDWGEVAQLARRCSLEVSGLTCDSGWPAEDHDLANKDRLNRQKAVDYFKRQIECAKTVGGDYLIVVPSAVGKFRSMGDDTSEDWKWAVESVRNLTDIAANNQVTLVIEPLNRYEGCIVNTAEDVSRFVTELNHPNVRALLDTYHMNIEESDIEKAFSTVRDCRLSSNVQRQVRIRSGPQRRDDRPNDGKVCKGIAC
jgi:D-psicose/D-tagatose/L-ribulose 3-epimerase